MTQGDPGPRSKDSNFNLVYDCINNRSILLITDKSSNNQETWTWNGSTWTKLSVTSPYPKNSASWTCDPANNRVIIWDRGMTVWNGSSWSYPSTTGFPNIYYQRIAYSPVDGKIYTHGGYEISGGVVVSDDLWVLNGTQWSKVADTGIFRYSHKALINPDDGSLILTGGLTQGNSGVFSVDKWNDGDSTALYFGEHSFSGGALRYDSSSRKIIVDSGDTFNEISTYNVKPAQVGMFSLRSAQVEEGISLYELKVSAMVSGKGYAGENCELIEGSFVDIWNNGKWLSIKANYDSAVTQITGTVEHPEILNTLKYSANDLISIAFRPVSDSGCGSAQGTISVTNPEITIRYINDENISAPPYDINEHFTIGNELKTWHDARNDCISQGGDLAVVDSSLKQEILERLLEPDQSYWIGGTDETEEDTWKWVNGNDFWIGNASGYQTGYHNWRYHQPDNHNGSQNYAKIWGGFSYRWDDGYSTDTEYYICEFNN
jgi:hypothetical protein